jgi:hypothetical protein
MAGRKMAELVLSEAERAELKLLSARRKTSQALALRTRIVRECAARRGEPGSCRTPARCRWNGNWRRRFMALSL